MKGGGVAEWAGVRWWQAAGVRTGAPVTSVQARGVEREKGQTAIGLAGEERAASPQNVRGEEARGKCMRS